MCVCFIKKQKTRQTHLTTTFSSVFSSVIITCMTITYISVSSALISFPFLSTLAMANRTTYINQHQSSKVKVKIHHIFRRHLIRQIWKHKENTHMLKRVKWQKIGSRILPNNLLFINILDDKKNFRYTILTETFNNWDFHLNNKNKAKNSKKHNIKRFHSLFFSHFLCSQFFPQNTGLDYRFIIYWAIMFVVNNWNKNRFCDQKKSSKGEGGKPVTRQKLNCFPPHCLLSDEGSKFKKSEKN